MPAKWVQSLLKLQANDLRIRDLEQRMKLLPSEMNALKAKRDQLVASTAAAAEALRLFSYSRLSRRIALKVRVLTPCRGECAPPCFRCTIVWRGCWPERGFNAGRTE